MVRTLEATQAPRPNVLAAHVSRHGASVQGPSREAYPGGMTVLEARDTSLRHDKVAYSKVAEVYAIDLQHLRLYDDPATARERAFDAAYRALSTINCAARDMYGTMHDNIYAPFVGGADQVRAAREQAGLDDMQRGLDVPNAPAGLYNYHPYREEPTKDVGRLEWAIRHAEHAIKKGEWAPGANRHSLTTDMANYSKDAIVNAMLIPELLKAHIAGDEDRYATLMEGMAHQSIIDVVQHIVASLPAPDIEKLIKDLESDPYGKAVTRREKLSRVVGRMVGKSPQPDSVSRRVDKPHVSTQQPQ